MTDKEYAKEIVTTILSQLGGSKFTTMTGAKLSYSINSKDQPVLHCKLPADIKIRNNINLVLITYNIGLDLYEYTLMNTRKDTENQIIKQINDVYAEELISLFEQETGLYCYL
ncbi:hypothetical protein [Aquella oligotrophica]|uniref:Uncharacterized protein n=1 Tax=Aquella oligotrophica TaxID=2067065 RepID=A0A2I7N4Z5_9NEIS|nr:hypothetical protein [Aquella oligotrophica]AUR51537.1 hypothetical protein CUN60_04280 [Aquella oligotrophica]